MQRKRLARAKQKFELSMIWIEGINSFLKKKFDIQ